MSNTEILWKFFFSVSYTEAIKRIHPCSFQISQVNNKSKIDFISQKHCDRCCAKISLHSFSPFSRFSLRLVSSSFRICSSMWKMPGGWDFPVIPKQWTLQKTWYFKDKIQNEENYNFGRFQLSETSWVINPGKQFFHLYL